MAFSHPIYDELTVQVRNLAQATSFYLAALAPLDYEVINQKHFEAPNPAFENPRRVALGPRGTRRVDVWLSQSTGPPTPVHVVFPAASIGDVRAFFAAGLNAKGRVVAPPNNLNQSDGMFASIISDIDGNRIEVCYAGDATNEAPAGGAGASVPPPSNAERSIQHWQQEVAEGTAAGSVASSETPKAASSPPRKSQPLKSAISTARSIASSEPVKVAMSAAAASQVSSKRSTSKAASRRGSVVSTPSINAGNKKVVGTLIGAAAGAALAYTMVRSKQDSVEQQDEHERRMRGIDAKAEARAHCEAVDRRQATGKVELADEDSGYGSASHHSGSPPLLNNHSATYPQPYNGQGSSRGRSSTRKYVDYGHRTTSPGTYQAPPSRRSSYGGSAASQTTVKPVQRSQSNASRNGKASMPAPPPPPPAPPSMPAPPPTRSRRNSFSGQAAGVSRQSSLKRKPPSSFQRAMGTEAPAAEAPPFSRAPSSYHSSGSARNGALPPSQSRSASAVRPSGSRRSSPSARDIPLPASVTPSKASARPPNSRRSPGTAQRTPLPPSEAPSMLTAKTLSRDKKPGRTNSKFDDLATEIVPDDSISCASEREEQREKERWLQRRGSRRSRRSSYHER